MLQFSWVTERKGKVAGHTSQPQEFGSVELVWQWTANGNLASQGGAGDLRAPGQKDSTRTGQCLAGDSMDYFYTFPTTRIRKKNWLP